MDVNIPEVVEEVTRVFERYQRALQENDIAVLDAAFWDSPHTIRYAFNDNGYGWDEIHKHRKARTGPSVQEKRLRTVVTTFGRNAATVNIEFKVRGQERTGRQTQTWIRFPETGWVVVSAHVSMMPGKD